MFTKIRLKNFKSFKEVTFDLTSKKGVCKPLAIVYGANGSGKTTILHALMVLKKTLKTMEIKGILSGIIKEKIASLDPEVFSPKLAVELLQSGVAMQGIGKIIDEYRMIDAQGNLSLEYEFIIEGASGSYYLEFDSTRIVKERLEYKLASRRGCYYEIEDGDVYINSKIFESKEFADLVNQQVEQYWGKHSVLSILYYEMSDKADNYINSNISKNLMKFMLSFDKMSYKMASSCGDDGMELNSSNSILSNLISGNIELYQVNELKKVEKLLNNFLKSLFSDVVKVYYKTSKNQHTLQYDLFLRKKIENHEYNIDFRMESDGTKEILKILPFLIAAVSGECVVIDEYGTGIHDILGFFLLTSIAKQIKGQLIIATHNTLLMESKTIGPEAFYFIMNDKTYKKSIKCITEIEDRLHPNYNYQKRYLTNDLYKSALPSLTNLINLEEWKNLEI